jgi:fatty-acyl-CoA synthase
LRPDVWTEFRDRFHLPLILEFYAATEGNITLFNFDSKPGAVGRIPAWAKRKFPIAIVKFDVESETLVRGPDGLCIECAPDEVGEALGKIVDDPKRPVGRFEGYADKTASDKKIARDVFEPGDAWFRSGDLLRRDAMGYFYFIDRIGDTFRWKGENVSTSEVAEVLTGFPGVRETTVYGVEVPGADGRAGMAAIVPWDCAALDLTALHAYLKRHLPAYARPIFLRMRKRLDTTGTFKQRKIELVAEGFDLTRSPDPLYFQDCAKGTFVPLDAALRERIVSGDFHL